MNGRCTLLRLDTDILLSLARSRYKKRLKKTVGDFCSSCNSFDATCFTKLFDYASQVCLRLCHAELCRAAGAKWRPGRIVLYNHDKRTRILVEPGDIMKSIVGFSQPPSEEALRSTLELMHLYAIERYQRNCFRPSFYPVAALISTLLHLYMPDRIGHLRRTWDAQLNLTACKLHTVLSQSAPPNRQIIWFLPVSVYSYAKLPATICAENLDNLIELLVPHEGRSFIFYQDTKRNDLSLPFSVYHYIFCRAIALLKNAPSIFQKINDMLTEHENLLDLSSGDTRDSASSSEAPAPQLLFDMAVEAVTSNPEQPPSTADFSHDSPQDLFNRALEEVLVSA